MKKRKLHRWVEQWKSKAFTAWLTLWQWYLVWKEKPSFRVFCKNFEFMLKMVFATVVKEVLGMFIEF